MPLLEAEALVRKLQGICDEQDKRDRELKHLVEQDREVAKARYRHGNETGAALAMKKILRWQQERTRVTVASDIASDALIDIQRAVQAAKQSYQSTVDIGHDNAYVLQEVQEVLSGCPPIINDREELLRQVRSL